MPTTATLFGAVVGIGVTCFKNGLQYLPVYRKPWEHVISATVAAYAFNWVVEQEDYLIKRIEEHYQQLSDKKSS